MRLVAATFAALVLAGTALAATPAKRFSAMMLTGYNAAAVANSWPTRLEKVSCAALKQGNFPCVIRVHYVSGANKGLVYCELALVNARSYAYVSQMQVACAGIPKA